MDPADIIIAILTGLWLTVPSYLPNSSAAFFGGGTPMDFGKKMKDGTRILGDGKTWKGAIAGTAAGFVIGFIQLGLLYSFDYPLGDYGNTALWTLGILFCLGGGAIFGDLLGSFVKRRLKVERGAKFPILDQYDFLIGSWLLILIFAFDWFKEFYLEGDAIFGLVAVLIMTPLLHRAVNIIGFKMGKKDVPW
jgi:CDP-2,3-bis-(O-geranylgeranyl)-sn-glycerol synthase